MAGEATPGAREYRPNPTMDVNRLAAVILRELRSLDRSNPYRTKQEIAKAARMATEAFESDE